MVDLYYVNLAKCSNYVFQNCFPCLVLGQGCPQEHLHNVWREEAKHPCLCSGVESGTVVTHTHCLSSAGSPCWPWDQQLGPQLLWFPPNLILQVFQLLGQMYVQLHDKGPSKRLTQLPIHPVGTTFFFASSSLTLFSHTSCLATLPDHLPP